MRVSLVPVIAVALSAVLLASACTNTEEETAVTESTQTQEAEASLPAFYSMPVEPLSEKERLLYDSVVLTLLEQDLWTARDMYDASHYLMVPMHYAYRGGYTTAIEAYADFFSRFVEDVTGEDQYGFQEAGILNSLQFYYFATQYMMLSTANGYADRIPEELPELAEKYASEYLLHHVANWGTEDTVLEHLRQVIAGKEYPYSYYSAIEDLDGFTLAILCDLRALGWESEATNLAAELAYEIYSSPSLNTETEKGGWLFEVGVWAEHPDYAYAGNVAITDTMEPRVRVDIPWDSSHFMRWPMWLNSYGAAQVLGERSEVFAMRRAQLANQMIHYVLKNVNGYWLTTTFMDGTNGVYRYEYHEEGEEGVGLEGYDLSGTFLIGWWSALEDERISKVYQEILLLFPMEGNADNPYFDHATIREQNPYFDMETGFDLGTFECTTMCASKV